MPFSMGKVNPLPIVEVEDSEVLSFGACIKIIWPYKTYSYSSLSVPKVPCGVVHA